MPNKLIRGTVHITGDLTVDGTLSPALGTEFVDSTFAIKDNGDATKKVSFQVSGVTAGQNRVLTVPDYNGTLATLGGTETLTAKTLSSPKIGTAICDTGGNEIVKTPATASAVNEVTITNAATTTSPSITATGDDTNISLKLGSKGTGKIVATSALTRFFSVNTNTTASDQTYTAAQIIAGMILRDPNGGARQDTLPTAADLLAAIPGAIVGTGFEFVLRNTADANETITVAAGAGGTVSGTATVAQSNSKRFLVVLTNIGTGTEAYTAYSLGTEVH